jgi:exodeoxyribonuclease VII small subunit
LCANARATEQHNAASYRTQKLFSSSLHENNLNDGLLVQTYFNPAPRATAHLPPDNRLDATAAFFYPPPMSKPAKAEPAKGNPLPFEEALQKLESVVEAMESGDLPLETLIKRYEEGVKLAQLCQAKLAEAELKISQLEKSAGGELKLKPFATDDEE